MLADHVKLDSRGSLCSNRRETSILCVENKKPLLFTIGCFNIGQDADIRTAHSLFTSRLPHKRLDCGSTTFSVQQLLLSQWT